MIRLPTDIAETIGRGGSVVVPSQQRAYAARLAHSAARVHDGQRVWPTPDILAVDTWLIREIERVAGERGKSLPRLLSNAEDWLIWRQCTAGASRDLELLDRGALAESLRRASALAADFCIDLATARVEFGAESGLLHEVQLAVAERCRASGASTLHSLARQLPDSAMQTDLSCAGFLNLSPRLKAMGASQRVAQSDHCRARAVIAHDELDELERIAAWCRNRIECERDVRLLVVLPGGAGARERLATLIKQAVDPSGWLSNGGAAKASAELVAIEGGGPLGEIPVVAHALTSLAWLSGSSAEFGSVSEWLRAPYWDEPDAGTRARIDLWLRERGPLSLRAGEWIQSLLHAPSPIAERARVLAEQLQAGSRALVSGAASPREWSERFRAALEAIHWPGERARGSSEQQTVVRFHELLDEFGQLASSTRSMSLRDAVGWFREFAQTTPFRPADCDAAVTISAALADPVVLYDGIWAACLHAEAFPQPVKPDPFVPLVAQLAAGVPCASAGGRLQEARALITAWRASTTDLVLSSPARAGDLELLPSPLLAEWLAERAPAAVQPETLRSAKWLAQRMHRSNQVEYLEDPLGVAWPQGQALPGTRCLELQNLCPFRAYAELRLGSIELDVPEPGVAADLRGNLLHAALERLWRQLRDSHTLAGYGDTMLEALIARSVADAAEEIFGAELRGDDSRSALLGRESRRTVRLIRTLCALERERSPFRVQDRELETTLTVSGARMQVRIDRIDVLETGGRAILDYKTGRRIPADWYGERPSHPQLLAYLAAMAGDAVAMATVNVTAREIRFDGIAASSSLIPDVKGVKAPEGGEPGDAWETRTREWLARIQRLAADFLAGRAAVDPMPDACKYCHVISVCRISDRGAGLVPGNDAAGAAADE